MDAAATSVNSTATGKGDRGALCIKMRKVPPAPPPGTAQGPWGHRETNVCDSTPVWEAGSCCPARWEGNGILPE